MVNRENGPSNGCFIPSPRSDCERSEKSRMTTRLSAGESTAQRSPPSQAPAVASNRVVWMVSGAPASAMSGGGASRPPHPAARSRAPREASRGVWGVRMAGNLIRVAPDTGGAVPFCNLLGAKGIKESEPGKEAPMVMLATDSPIPTFSLVDDAGTSVGRIVLPVEDRISGSGAATIYLQRESPLRRRRMTDTRLAAQ